MNVLLFARDPGGANVIGTIGRNLASRGIEAELYGKDMALARYRVMEYPGRDIHEETDVQNAEELTSWLRRKNPDLVLTATSADDFTERYLWRSARTLGIKSAAILDQWMNYGIRFSNFTPAQMADYEVSGRHDYQPDYFLVMDEYSRRQVMDLIHPAPASRIVVTGHPYLEWLGNQGKSMVLTDRAGFRSQRGLASDCPVVVFASEPTAADYGGSDQALAYWGFNETVILETLIRVLDHIVQEHNIKPALMVKPHPREDAEKIRQYAARNSSRFPVCIEQEANSFELAAAADLVAGMSSMFLMESVVLGCPTISILCGLKRENPFILDRLHVMPSIVTESALNEALTGILVKGTWQRPVWDVANGAMARIIEFVEGC